MINTLLTHKIRKDLLRQNKKHNHIAYLQALKPGPKIKYWAGYHKKKLIFLGLVVLISWNYDLHTSLFHNLLEIRSPKQVLSHLFFNSTKVEKTVNQQKIVGWNFKQNTLELLTKLYYETDKRLIFGLGRNYLYEVYSNIGLLQNEQDIATFWRASGFYKLRNQMISGVGYQQFITLYKQGYKSLKKINPDLNQEDYLKLFLQKFLEKATSIQRWQQQFNKKRYQQYLKNLLTDNEKKTEEICKLMKQNIQITEQQVEDKLEEMGMKGMGIRDKWLYWRNRQVLFSLRQYNIHKRLKIGIIEGRERSDLQKKLNYIEKQLSEIEHIKETLKQKYKNYYSEELI